MRELITTSARRSSCFNWVWIAQDDIFFDKIEAHVALGNDEECRVVDGLDRDLVLSLLPQSAHERYLEWLETLERAFMHAVSAQNELRQ